MSGMQAGIVFVEASRNIFQDILNTLTNMLILFKNQSAQSAIFWKPRNFDFTDADFVGFAVSAWLKATVFVHVNHDQPDDTVITCSYRYW